MTVIAEWMLATSPVLLVIACLVIFVVGIWLGWAVRGSWETHKAEAAVDEGEQP